MIRIVSIRMKDRTERVKKGKKKKRKRKEGRALDDDVWVAESISSRSRFT